MSRAPLIALQHPLVGDSIASIKSFGDVAVSNAPWLRLELKSGRFAEIAPTSKAPTTKPDEKLGISVELVSEFKPACRWPGGPLETWNELESLKAAINRPIEGVEFRSIHPARVRLLFQDGGSLSIRHSERLPMSIETELHERDAV